MSLAILTSVTACAHDSPVSEFCLIAKPIYTSPQDTPVTLRQIDVHNAKGVRLCDW